MTTLPLSANPLLQPDRSAASLESEMDRLPHLPEDRRQVRKLGKIRLREAQQARHAAAAMGGRLPTKGEAIHMIISGRFALWDYVPAVLSLAKCKINVLTIATLGFSRRNIVCMAELVDGGQIGAVRLLCSHYFAGTSSALYDFAVETFGKRPKQMQFLSVRTHAKVVCMSLANGRWLTVESSANLRSCKNIEQATIIGGRAVHDFHAGWIGDLFREAK